MAFSKGLGAVHSMSHACGADQALRLHHGTLNAVETSFAADMPGVVGVFTANDLEVNPTSPGVRGVDRAFARPPLAKDTVRNGKPAIEDPDIRQRLSTLEGYIRSHQYSGYRQLTKDAAGESVGILSMMNKIISTNIGHMVASLSLDLLGDEGLMGAGDRDLGSIPRGSEAWIAHYMFSLGIAVAGGTANIQRNVIAERGLGLPRDAAADRSSGK